MDARPTDTSPSDVAMILVHPGSMYGSAAMEYGKYDAQSMRDGVYSVIGNHTGPFVVIDGALSDEIHDRDNDQIAACLQRADESGQIAYRLWGDDDEVPPYKDWKGHGSHPLEHKGQVEATSTLVEKLRGCNKIYVIGAWASDDLYGEGCVNSVAAELHDNLPDTKVFIHEYSVFVPSEDDDEDGMTEDDE